MTLGQCCVKKPTEVVFHNALKLCSCEKLIILLSLKYHDVDSKIFNQLFRCRRLSNDRESQCIRSTEICLKGGQHFWALYSFIMGFNSYTCSLGISTSLSKPHLINWHERPLFIENIGKKQRTMQSRSIKWQFSFTGSKNCEVESVWRLFQSCAFFLCVRIRRYACLWSRRTWLLSSLTSWPGIHWNQQTAIVYPFSILCGLVCFSRASYPAAAAIN